MTKAAENTRAAVAALQADSDLSVSDAARRFGVPRTTVRDALARSGGRDAAGSAGIAARPDGSIQVTGDSTDPATLLTEQGLDPEEWQLVRARTGWWGDPMDPRKQIRLDAVPRSVIDLAAEPYTELPPPSAPTSGDRSVVICTDHHAPHQDPGLHQAFCSLLSDQRPALLAVLGDVGDYASVSRHRDTLGFAQGVRSVNRSVYKLLHDYRVASPETQVIVMTGNHDARIEHYIHDNAPELWEVGPAFEEDMPSYDLRRLWRLDDLGIEFIEGDWERNKYPLTDSLDLRHGYMTAEGTPQKMLNKHGRSQVQGHDHRLRFTYKTRHTPVDVRLHVSAGCMCIVEDGLGYAAEPDWQQGCVVGHVWDDGDFALAPAPYVEGHGLLLADGRRYAA